MGYNNYARYMPVGYLSTTATSSTAVSATLPTASSASGRPTEPNYAVLVCEVAGIRWRDDGTAAINATSGGAPLAVGQYMEYDGDLRKLSMISQAGTATIHVSFYRTF